MRYIGSKVNLLANIESCITENIKTPQASFCDIFSGTAVVARYFKSKYKIISNDSLYFSYVIQKAYVENNSNLKFSKLKNDIRNPFLFLENENLENIENDFITQNYSPAGKDGRMYFTEENAKRIDFIRATIEKWKDECRLSESEYLYLLASLIEAVPSVSNITGTYGAYLKKWDKRAFKKLKLHQDEIFSNGMKNKVYNEDSLKLIKRISGDILYIDPPYNSRQYAPNYHVLETIACYDNPELSGITGMRSYDKQKSAFCSKSEVGEAFQQLIANADFSHIIMSYNSSGLMKENFIEKVLKDNGIASTYTLKKIPYRKYKSKIYDESDVCEYLFYIQKKTQGAIYVFPKEKFLAVASPKFSHKPSRKEYIKSPLNYIGGKYKLLPQLLPLFPQDTETFVDLFCGGGNVGVNANCKKIIFNDMNSILIEMFSAFNAIYLNELLAKIERTISQWNLSMTNKDSFLRFRDYYNKTRDPIDLYVLSCFSFNYQLRFNNAHEYNNPFGKERSQFSDAMRDNLINFVSKIQSSKVKFTSIDFAEFPVEKLGEKDFVYCDPPYLITTGSYNDGNRGFKNWTKESDKKLFSLLDNLNERKIRFALSNVFSHKGETNEALIQWSKNYNTYHLKNDYSNSCYNTNRIGSDEVLITNY